MKDFLRRHSIALFLALAVGMCTGVPIVLAPIALGEEYKGIQYMPLNDEDIYRARIHEILDGHYGVTSPFLYEYKESSLLWPPINEWLYALPAFVFGLSAVVVASKFLLPAVLFFLIYILTRKLLGEEERLATICALAAGSAATLGISFVDYTYMSWLVSGKELAPVMWTRLVNPITGGVQLFGFLLLLWLVWQRTWRYAYVPAGILLALMIGYYFAFALGLAVLGVLFLIALARKEFPVALELVYAGIISVLLDSWIWYNVFTSIGGAEGKVLAMRNGMFFTHAPVLNKVLLLATLYAGLCFLFSYAWRKDRTSLRNWLFLFALLGASWLAFNQQVITGRQIWYHHFVQYTVPISMLAVIAASYFTFKNLLPRLLGLGMMLLISVSLLNGIVSIGSYVRDMPLWFRADQRYGELASWLLRHSSKDCVVLDIEYDPILARNIAAYSGCNVYFTDVGYAGIPEERIVHNFLARMAFQGVAPKEALSYLEAHPDSVREDFYPDWNAMFGWDSVPWIEERMRSLAGAYEKFSERPLEAQIRTYRVDFVISTSELPSTLQRELPHLKFLENVGIYRVYVFNEVE